MTAAVAWALYGCGGGLVELPDELMLAEEDTSLGPGDVFEVRVFGEEDLSSTYRVSQDGTIDFPLIGRMDVRGLEPTQISDRIAAGLREGDFLRSPQVSIFVQEYTSKRVTVIGAVENAGSFPLSPGMTVIQAISQAGGFTSLANRGGTILSRRINGELRRFNIPVDAIIDGRAADPPVRNGDIIRVPERIL